MKLTRDAGILGLAALAVIASPLVVAGDSGLYVGANVGQSRAEIDDARITNNLLGSGFTSASITHEDREDRDTGYKLFVGYQFNRNFALEGGYFDLGEFSYTATTVPTGTLNGKIKLKGVNLDVVGILPITARFAAFGRVGVNYAEAKNYVSGTGAVNVLNPDPSKRDTNYKFGLGLQYALTESLAMRAEAERYRIDDALGNKGDVDLVSLGLVYKLGKTAVPRPEPEPVVALAPPPPPPEPEVVTPPPPPPPEPEPEVVTPPPPVVVAAPPPRPPAPTKVTFAADSSADSLFDFGKSIIKPGGKQAIDKFSSDLKGAEFDVITVTGHTDRIGSAASNLKLSVRRAEVVKAYLVDSAGIPASKIEAIGLGETQPVTSPGECKGKKATKKLVACLAPDRRVEVEVKAQRTVVK